MTRTDTQKLETAYRSIIKESVEDYPSNWDKGFPAPYRIAAGGREVPFRAEGGWYILVWDSENKKHEYYSYANDKFYPEDYFEDAV